MTLPNWCISEYHAYQPISFMTDADRVKHFVSFLSEQRQWMSNRKALSCFYLIETGQCYGMRHSMDPWTLVSLLEGYYACQCKKFCNEEKMTFFFNFNTEFRIGMSSNTQYLKRLSLQL